MTPLGSSSVTGSGALLKTGRHLTLVIQLAAPTNRRGSSFAVWLTGNGPPKLLGFVPPTRAAGTFSGDAPLPAYASRYRAVLITRESSQSPRRPGTRVLRGALSLPIPAA
jgi:hypothetical protein